MSDQPPKIDKAPGLKWTRRKTGWEARWRARLDLVQKGYRPKSVPLWKGATLDETPGETPGEAPVAYIIAQCDRLQSEMLIWGRGGIAQVGAPFDGTLKTLIQCYQTDPDSDYRKLRFQSRHNTDARCRRLDKDHGHEKVAGIKARVLLRWHEGWAANGKVATGHSLIAMMRTLMGFGATFLEDVECARVRGILTGMKFEMGQPRCERLTADQATAIRAAAHAKGLHSIALAQAFQFELMLRQKDVIGEWVPTPEPGVSDVTAGNDKWLRGIRWSEIDSNLILRHMTSKRQKVIEINLKLAQMVMEEFARLGQLPTSGPMIVFENTGVPYLAFQFRREWRRIAKSLGIPANVFNMDSRSGAITEATDAGVPLEHVRHAATHSNISTTQGYSRGGVEKTAEVMRLRSEHRNKK